MFLDPGRAARCALLVAAVLAFSVPISRAEHRQVVETCDGYDDEADENRRVDDGCDARCDAPRVRDPVPVNYDPAARAFGCWTGRAMALLWNETTGVVRLGLFHPDGSTVVPSVFLDTEGSAADVGPAPDHVMALYLQGGWGEEEQVLCLERRGRDDLSVGGRTCRNVDHVTSASWTWVEWNAGFVVIEKQWENGAGFRIEHTYLCRTEGTDFDPESCRELEGYDADAAVRIRGYLEPSNEVGIAWVHHPFLSSRYVAFQRFSPYGYPLGQELHLTGDLSGDPGLAPRVAWREDEWGVLRGGPGGIAALVRISRHDEVLATVEIGPGRPLDLVWTGQEYGMVLDDGQGSVLYRYDPELGTVSGPVRIDGSWRATDLAWTGNEYEIAKARDQLAILQRIDCCDDVDGDGFDECRDVEDREADAYPGAPELCNGLDDDQDGTIDEGCPRECPGPFPRSGEVRVTEDPADSRTTPGRSLAWRGNRWHVGWSDAPGDAPRGAWYVPLDADGRRLAEPAGLADRAHEDDVVCLDAHGERAGLWSLEPDGDGTLRVALDRHGGDLGEPPLFVAPGRPFGVDDVAWSGNAHAVLLEREDPEDGWPDLFLARYDVNGHGLHPPYPLTGEDARPEGGAAETTVAWTGDGYGVAWTDRRGGSPGIWFRPLSAWGYPSGPEVQVGPPLGPQVHEKREPALAWKGDGYGIAWADLRDGTWRVYFALLDPEGNFLENPGEVPVSSGEHDARRPAVAWNGQEFAVAWEEWTHPWESEIHVARVLADGTVTGEEAVVGARSPGASFRVDIAWNGTEWGVAWTDQRDDNEEVYFAAIACCREASPPGVVTGLRFDPDDEDKRTVSWDPVPGADAYDLLRGDLDVLRDSGGDFSAAVSECLADDLPETSFTEQDDPEGNAFYLVRAQNCRGAGTWDSGGPGQHDPRDAEIAASPNACP